MSSDFGRDDVGEALAQPSDDLARLVNRERGLGDEGDVGRGPGASSAVDVVDGLDQDDVLRGLARRALDLLVALVADEDDRVALLGELAGLDVDLGDQRAGGVDRPQVAGLRRWRGRSARRRGRRRRPACPPAPRSPPRRRSRRASRAARPRACCGRSPCARRPAGRACRARARPSGRRGRRPRSSRAARQAARALVPRFAALGARPEGSRGGWAGYSTAGCRRRTSTRFVDRWRPTRPGTSRACFSFMDPNGELYSAIIGGAEGKVYRGHAAFAAGLPRQRWRSRR